MIKEGNITDLEANVIYNDLCCYCGACVAFCKTKLKYENEIPRMKERCFELRGICYDFCPRTFFDPFEIEKQIFGATREDNALGFYRGNIITAKATSEAVAKKAQDGGIISSLLTFMMEDGEIDAAVVAKETEGWKTEPFVATSKEEIIDAAGSKYTQTPSLLGLADAFEKGKNNIAFVGLPCHIASVRKIELSNSFNVSADRIKMVFGLFCTETFDSELFENKMKELGVKREDVENFNINKGYFVIRTKNDEIKIPINDMKENIRGACKYCIDFTSEFADISVGSIGSESGWSTVICRTEKALNLMKKAEEKGVIKTKKLSSEKIEEVTKFALRKKMENIHEKTSALELLNLKMELGILNCNAV